uniref:Uncharacterized protein n=1 Tax=Plectus sambesii TaxID=2011161 RepID=A0A914VRG7_9BILA
MAPKIIGAALDDDQNYVSIDWMLTDKYCPGYIRRYELILSCNSDQAISSGNLHFDCRSGFQGPKLNGTVPGNCKKENTYIKLRIGTTNSTSDESEQFLLKNEAVSTLVIIAYVLGAFLIAAAIASVIFYYYYKRHVKTFQNAHQAVRKLLHIQQKSGVGQSFRARSAPDLPIPDIPEGCNSPGGTTAYQTIVATSEVGSPHSLQVPERKNETDSNIPPDYAGYTNPEFQECALY